MRKLTIYTLAIMALIVSGCVIKNAALNNNSSPKNSVNNNNQNSNVPTLYPADSTVRINEYSPLFCKSDNKKCSQIKIVLEADLTKESSGDKLTGKFYIRGYLDNKKIGEKQLTQNYNPFCGDGGQKPCKPDTDVILTIDKPWQSNFYLTYKTDKDWSSDPGYFLTIKNTPTTSSYNDRFVGLSFEDNILYINFPQ